LRRANYNPPRLSLQPDRTPLASDRPPAERLRESGRGL